MLYNDSQPKSSGLILGRRPRGAILHSSNEPGELSRWLCHDDSTINIVLVIIIIWFIFCALYHVCNVIIKIYMYKICYVYMCMFLVGGQIARPSEIKLCTWIHLDPECLSPVTIKVKVIQQNSHKLSTLAWTLQVWEWRCHRHQEWQTWGKCHRRENEDTTGTERDSPPFTLSRGQILQLILYKNNIT